MATNASQFLWSLFPVGRDWCANKSLQATRDGGSSSASRPTLIGSACLSSGRCHIRTPQKNMKHITYIMAASVALVLVGCSKKSDTMTEDQAKAAGYTVVVTNDGLKELFPDHIVINGANVPITSSNITLRRIE
jgi:hypothetical protein